MTTLVNYGDIAAAMLEPGDVVILPGRVARLAVLQSSKPGPEKLFTLVFDIPEITEASEVEHQQTAEAVTHREATVEVPPGELFSFLFHLYGYTKYVK